MKILSWNINGIRASKVDLKKLFDSLDADVICLQETKVTRDMLDEPTAIVEGYNSYFSFSKKKSGYSGVANFCRDSATPYKAEDGLSGVLTLKDEGSVGCYGNLTSFTDDELQALDAEGRAVITQHKIKIDNETTEDLAIINVYCPRADPDREDRLLYKLRFFALLQTRAEALLKAGSHVIVLGDINTAHKQIDHCDPTHGEFLKQSSRIWLNQFLREEDRDSAIPPVSDQEEFAAVTAYTEGGLFVDTLRYLHPDQEGAFTNWCALTGARATNYGRRLDYILGNTDLVVKCLTGASIMPDVEGSDHCPIKAELNCKPVTSKSCPPLCTKLMPEFAGKQKKLSMFFTKLKKGDTVPKSEPVGDLSTKSETNGDISSSVVKNVTEEEHVDKLQTSVSQTGSKRPNDSKNNKSAVPLKKRKTDNKKPDIGAKQSSLKSFFTSNSKQEKKVASLPVESSPKKPDCTVNTSFSKYFSSDKSAECDLEEERKEKTVPIAATVNSSLDKEQNPTEVSKTVGSENKTVSAWKNLLGGLGPAPLCKGHKEPCVLRMVKKEGPNKGKQFYTCARGEGLKSNPEARCDFFKWVDKKKT